MTQAVSLTQSQNEELGNLYDQDLQLWLETTIAQLKRGDLQSLDVANLIEELEGLAGRDRRELESRLTTLLEHLLKRLYVDSEYDYGGWVRTINRTRLEIRKILKQSPSLKNYAQNPELLQELFDDAVGLLRADPDYQKVSFPDTWQFDNNLDALLSVNFWEMENIWKI